MSARLLYYDLHRIVYDALVLGSARAVAKLMGELSSLAACVFKSCNSPFGLSVVAR